MKRMRMNCVNMRKQCSDAFMDLSLRDLRSLAFQLAEVNGIALHSQSRKKLAGKDSSHRQ